MNHYYKSPQSNVLRNLFGLRRRYLFTRNNRLRLRYSASALSCVLVATVVFGMQSSDTSAGLYNSLPDHAAYLDGVEPQGGEDNLQAYLSDSLKAQISDSMRSAPQLIKKAEEKPLLGL